MISPCPDKGLAERQVSRRQPLTSPDCILREKPHMGTFQSLLQQLFPVMIVLLCYRISQHVQKEENQLTSVFSRCEGGTYNRKATMHTIASRSDCEMWFKCDELEASSTLNHLRSRVQITRLRASKSCISNGLPLPFETKKYLAVRSVSGEACTSWSSLYSWVASLH